MDKIERVADRAMRTQGVTMRPINMKKFQAEVERVWDVYNSAWDQQLGFRPHDAARNSSCMGKEMKQILKPELVLIGEVEGRAVGFALALPDINHGAETGRRENYFPRGCSKSCIINV